MRLRWFFLTPFAVDLMLLPLGLLGIGPALAGRWARLATLAPHLPALGALLYLASPALPWGSLAAGVLLYALGIVSSFVVKLIFVFSLVGLYAWWTAVRPKEPAACRDVRIEILATRSRPHPAGIGSRLEALVANRGVDISGVQLRFRYSGSSEIPSPERVTLRRGEERWLGPWDTLPGLRAVEVIPFAGEACWSRSASIRIDNP